MATAIKTLNRKITHKIVPINDEQMFAALSQAFDELADGITEEILENYVLSHLSMLQVKSPDLIALSVCRDGIVILHYLEEVRFVQIAGLGRVEITQALVNAARCAF